jgi:hypothetical protein
VQFSYHHYHHHHCYHQPTTARPASPLSLPFITTTTTPLLPHYHLPITTIPLQQGNLSITNLKDPKILFFIAGILLFLGLFSIELTTEGLEIKFFIAGILL